MSIRILHTADLHMDSPFEALPLGKASVRRAEQRLLLEKISELAYSEKIDVVLLAGDLLDTSKAYSETGEELIRALRGVPAQVFVSPGNHDFYSSRSPWAKLRLPENVHVFRENRISCFDMSDLGYRVYGAAFTDRVSPPLLTGFTAEKTEGVYNLMCIHGDADVRNSPYNPISSQEIAGSGMDYIALGHVHAASGLQRSGDVFYSVCGCPEGRGFDECGEKTVNLVEFSPEGCSLETACIASRRYESLSVDVTDIDPLLAVHSMLPDETVRDVYRITLTGETDEDIDVSRLRASLGELFFELQLRNETRLRSDIWEKAGDSSLRALFLKKLKEKYDSAESDSDRFKIEQAARWGLAALNNSEEVHSYED